MQTFEKTANDYLAGMTHLGKDHPTPHALRKAAEQLDKKFSISVFREYNSLIGKIEASKPVRKKKQDPLLAPE